jgi:bacteriorhodopsin
MVTTWNWIGVISMFIGVIIFGLNTRRATDEYSKQSYVTLFFVPLIALALYLMMALGQGVTEVEGRRVYWIRYVTWFTTTPLLLNQIARVVHARQSVKISLILSDLFMIATGGIAELSPTPINYLWYTVSSIAFLFILYLLYVDLTAEARGKPADVVSLFRTLRDVNAVVWIGYPIVWILGVPGIDLFGIEVQTALFTILDVASKVGFGMIIVLRRPVVEHVAKLGSRDAISTTS